MRHQLRRAIADDVGAAPDRAARDDTEISRADHIDTVVTRVQSAYLTADRRQIQRHVLDVPARNDVHVAAGKRTDPLHEIAVVHGPRGRTAGVERVRNATYAPQPIRHELVAERATDSPAHTNRDVAAVDGIRQRIESAEIAC